MSKHDGLPNQICETCLEETNRIHKFIDLCKQSEETLSHYRRYLVTNSNASNSIKVETHYEVSAGDDLQNSSENIYYSDEILEPDFNKDLSDLEKNIIDSEEKSDSVVSNDTVKNKLSTKSKSKLGCKRKEKVNSSDDDEYFLDTEIEYLEDDPESKSSENLTEIDEKFSCKVCEKLFEDEESLEHHSKTHIKKRKTIGPFKCKHCDKEFKLRKNLWQHERSHGEKKYLCNFCGRAFLVLSNLNQHVRMHTGQYSYTAMANLLEIMCQNIYQSS